MIRKETSHFQSWLTTCPVTNKQTPQLWGLGLEFHFPLLLTRDLAVLSELDVTSFCVAFKISVGLTVTRSAQNVLQFSTASSWSDHAKPLNGVHEERRKIGLWRHFKFPFHLFHSLGTPVGICSFKLRSRFLQVTPPSQGLLSVC